MTECRDPRTTREEETRRRRRRSRYISRSDAEEEKQGKTLFVAQAKETSAADIKLRIDGPEAASADNAVEVENFPF